MNNYSRQREMILEVIKENRIHPTAEDIYNLTLIKEPKISKSTVYRNINVLVENGNILKITMASGPDRYDYLHETHYHVICESCGNVFDFYYDFEIDKISKSIENQINHKFIVNNVTVNGICEKCKSKKEGGI